MNTELKDTVALMNSADYKDRFNAEFEQLQIRINKLSVMLHRWSIGDLNFTPICPRYLLEKQLQLMVEYRNILVARAYIEKISLDLNDK